MKIRHLHVLLGLGLLALPEARGGSFTADFNDGLTPANTALYGNGDGTSGVIELTGGVANSGCLKLTKAVNGKQGAMIIEDLDAGLAVNSFTANFKIRIGGGSNPPADGFGFCFANDLPNGGFGEGGAGSGLKVGVDIYNNPDDAPAIKIYWNNAQVATTGILPLATLQTDANFVDMMVRVNPNGTLDVTYNGQAMFTNLITGFQPITGGRFGLGARTGGLNTNHFIDDLSIATTQGEFLLPQVRRAPISARIIAGYPAPMNVLVNGLSAPTYQWEKKAPADPGFTAIPGAEAAAYFTAPLTLADAGVQYRVIVGNENGDTVASDPATFDVVTLPHATPDTVAYNFNDGTVPAGTGVFGSAAITAAGGVDNTGYLSLTEDTAGLAGTWIVDDQNAGGPVGGIDVAFKLLLTPPDGTTPADGFGFHWAPDLPEAGFPGAEDPVGTGLSVGFDTYNNGGGEAPAVDVFWLGQRLGGALVPGELLNTLNNFVDVQIRLSSAGLVDVSFNGVVLAYQLQIPNWTAFSGARYGFAARTGGAFEKHYVDSVQIKSTPYVGPIGFVTNPTGVTTHIGHTPTFRVTSNDPLHTTYQWQVAPAGGSFSNIGGANADTYTTPPLAFSDDGNQYRCHIVSTVNASVADSTPAVVTVVNLGRPATAQILDTFDDQATANNTGTVPAAVHTFTGNFNFNGGPYLALTDAANDQYGSMVIDDFNGGLPVGGFTAALKVQIAGGAGNPADGWSFSWGTAITAPTANGGHEAGLGNDLRLGFYTYGAAGGGGRSFRVNWRGTEILNLPQTLEALQTPDGVFEEVLIRVTPATATTTALLDVTQGGSFLARNLALNGLQGIAGAKFAIAARTGGANELHAYDDVAINTSLYVGPITVESAPPASQYVLMGKAATLTVVSSNPPQTTYQWQSGPGAAGPFANIDGATSATYVTPPQTVADSGKAYQVVMTGPTNIVNSVPAVLIVVDPALPATWETNIPFTNGELPIDGSGITLGTAAGLTDGGTDGTGTMSLTTAVNGLAGSFALSDQDAGTTVDGFVAQFQFLIGSSAAGNASNPPADGAGFVWSPEAITGAFGEGGTGTGLIVAFDTYDNVDGNPDNAAGEAPAIRAIWGGTVFGNLRVPRSLLESGLDYRNVVVRVNPGGTLDVIYGDSVIFWNLPIPEYAPITGGSFGWGARTGGLNAEQNVDDIHLTTFAATGGPTLSFSESGANIVITFDGVLETSTDLQAWTPMVDQASPLIVPKASLTGRLFIRSRK